MALHRHVLLIADEETPLAYLCIRFEQDRQESHSYATRPDGAVRLISFPNTAHEEGDIRRFAVRIENAVAAENTFRDQQKASAAQAEKNLKEALADTGARDAVRLHVAQITSLHQNDHRRKPLVPNWMQPGRDGSPSRGRCLTDCDTMAEHICTVPPAEENPADAWVPLVYQSLAVTVGAHPRP
ncbi:hypothetical protein [Streptomyces decoyicus]|uniref:hypothetical protein n=1 Tax=Streptomyces decoyicus TaxID=249567 RepID=UPI003649ABC1